MTYQELTDRIRREIWLGQEGENLIAVHAAYFTEALWDICKVVPCYQTANADVYPHCATYFNCGMTVLPQPAGKINRVYVIDRIDPVTGAESATGEDEWCKKVFLNRVEFCHIERYVKLSQQCSNPNYLATTFESFYTLLFGPYRNKRRYPKPTDEGMEALPVLPPGFHYPQASTDAAGPACDGVYATHRGRIYIAPWIQSAETVVVEWSGIKRQWSDSDLVEDDPKFRQAVRLHVAHQHESSFGEPAKAAAFHMELYGGPNSPGVIPLLIHECEEQNRVLSCAEDGRGSMARGMGLQSNLFYNDTKFEFTAHCPAGKTGGPFTVVKEIGSVPSAMSVADANARASQKAQDEANARLVACVTPEIVYWNTVQLGNASCPGPSADGLTPAATGPATTATEPANLHSAASQAAADALAKAAADAKARALLTCTFHNAAQTRQATCPADTTGAATEATIAAGQAEYDSTISQVDADTNAGIAAQNAAEALLVCVGLPTFLVGNTIQQAQSTRLCFTQFGQMQPIFAASTVQAGTRTKLATAATQAAVQAEVNAQALALAQSNVNHSLVAQCSAMGGVIQ